MSAALEVSDLHAKIGDLEILSGVDLTVPFGEIHALMGPNGSGKSTLCHVLLGKPDYEPTGSARVDGESILDLEVDARVRAGLFATFQYPVEIYGVSLRDLFTEIVEASGNGEGLWDEVDAHVAELGVQPFLDRAVNVDLSGGEKKRSELLQLLSLRPKAAVLDEIDSGLDIDAVREVAAAVEGMRRPDLGILLITHYSRILRYLTVDRVHIMMGGRIVRSGDAALADELDAKGYEEMRKELGIVPSAGEEDDPFADL